MKYARILSYVQSALWAIDPEKLSEIVSVLAFRAAGGEFTPEEIQARIGDGRAATAARGAVAVVPIRGTIAHRIGSMEESSGGTSAEAIGAMFQQALSDPGVASIVLDVDSPGGTVTGVSEVAQQIAAARGQKRVVAVTNGMNASAAYWISSQADEIVSIPSGRTGSIGVYVAHQDISKALEKKGIDVTLISAGKYKVEGNPFEPLSEEAKARLQAEVDDAYATFVKDVAAGRGVSQASVREGYGQGRALTAKDALKAGLIDRIGSMDDVLGSLMGRRAPAGQRADAVSVDMAARLL